MCSDREVVNVSTNAYCIRNGVAAAYWSCKTGQPKIAATQCVDGFSLRPVAGICVQKGGGAVVLIIIGFIVIIAIACVLSLLEKLIKGEKSKI
ncbi:MAG: hypothetical protein EZS28_051761 [Streblomastix strix]|uniref:Uncharacterized protein n=1 Tax=Streblomastix strix TaxID=222440 RepID=A0A5J4T428_9EUKA|nr:MAG: hypothetical protein EZS28_051761 [Streblomastix strix]